MLALACHFSKRPDARSNPNDPSTVGDHFFNEARRLLSLEEPHPSITEIQALAIMSLREAGCGRDSAGWMYSGRAINTALDLGLHLPIDSVASSTSPTFIEVRRITISGLFTLDKYVNTLVDPLLLISVSLTLFLKMIECGQ
jgi:hypothetical protein